MINTASKFCAGVGCFCGYDCGQEKTLKPLELLGDSKECPLAKYKMPTERIPLEEVVIAPPTIKDVEIMCNKCEFAHGYADRVNIFTSHCIDCPVRFAEENIYEEAAAAEFEKISTQKELR